jgi:hypothetical protein
MTAVPANNNSLVYRKIGRVFEGYKELGKEGVGFQEMVLIST